MPIVEWNFNYILGVKEIDDHHQHLVELLNRAYDEFKAGINVGLSVVRELVDYAAYHFSCEESWMSETSYSNIVEHRQEHDIFTLRSTEFLKKYKENEDISLELLLFLRNWITYHILETDAKFGRFLDIQKIRSRTNK